jgi:hypothetical protein
MHLKLVFSSQRTPLDTPENAGFENVRAMLGTALAQGHTVEIIDTVGLSDGERERFYIYEAMPAAGNRYRIRRVFGSNSKSGAEGFGREYPGLLVSETQGRAPHDVYPHEDGQTRQITTIMSFLDSLLAVAATK